MPHGLVRKSCFLILPMLAAVPAPAAELDNLPEQSADLDQPRRGETRPAQFMLGALGVAVVNTGRFVGSDERVTVPLPLVYFNYNDRLYWSIASVGAWLWRSDDRRFKLGLLAKARGGIEGDRTPYTGILDRDPSVDAGLNLTWRLEPLVLGASWLGDALGRSHGQTANLRLSWPIRLSERWTTTPGVAVEWQDGDMVDYYYGVTAAETVGGAPLYTGTGATNLRAGWALGYKLSRQWRLSGGVSYTHLGTGLADSPLVSQPDNLLVYAAVSWSFFHTN